MGETRVDLIHLLEDLRDAYPGAAEETILTEIVANALDSGARAITMTIDPAAGTFTVADDGAGMRRRELARYHDLGTSSKVRGRGIGFAGVGIKLALLVSREVLTETRWGRRHVATSWALASRHRAPWRWVPPVGLLSGRGTAVRLAVDNPLSPLLDSGFIDATLRRHFQPLLDPTFAEILATHYPRGVRFVVNERALGEVAATAAGTASIAVRMARKRKPVAVGYLSRESDPLPEDQRGVGVSTFGKVIKQGWDWLGIAPASTDRITGLIEAPALAECLTLNKADFIRSGARGALYLAYRKAIQEAVGRQLAAWGDAPGATGPDRRRAVRPVERDLEAVLLDLAQTFPLLASLVEHRRGGQRSLMTRPRSPTSDAGGPTELVAGSAVAAGTVDRERVDEPTAEAPVREPSGDGASPPPAVPSAGDPASAPGRPEARRERYGLSIQFEHRPDDPEIGRLVESTVWVNEAHPAYRRAVASRSEGYHVALAVALALAPLAVEPAKEHAFVTAFLASWGAALDRRTRRGRPRGR